MGGQSHHHAPLCADLCSFFRCCLVHTVCWWDYEEETREEIWSSLNSVQFSFSVMSDSLQTHGLQHPRPPCPSPTPRLYSNSCPLSQWCRPIISSSVVPFSSCPQSFPASGSSPLNWLCIRWPKCWEFQLQHQFSQWTFRIDFLWDWLVWSPCSPRDSQESSPALQFKSINSLALGLLNSPTLTSVIHDCWKNHSLDYMELCRQSDVFAF